MLSQQHQSTEEIPSPSVSVSKEEPVRLLVEQYLNSISERTCGKCKTLPQRRIPIQNKTENTRTVKTQSVGWFCYSNIYKRFCFKFSGTLGHLVMRGQGSENLFNRQNGRYSNKKKTKNKLSRLWMQQHGNTSVSFRDQALWKSTVANITSDMTPGWKWGWHNQLGFGLRDSLQHVNILLYFYAVNYSIGKTIHEIILQSSSLIRECSRQLLKL